MKLLNALLFIIAMPINIAGYSLIGLGILLVSLGFAIKAPKQAYQIAKTFINKIKHPND